MSVVLGLVVAGCGGDGADPTPAAESDDSVTLAAAAWATPLLSKKGWEGAAVMASSDYAPGTNRVTFLLVRNDSSLIRAPVAEVFYRPSVNWGKHWIVIQPRGVAFQGFQILDVKAKAAAVTIGDRAPASANPTLATRPASRITTARPPDLALLRFSVADSLRAKKPFVVAFATPALCESRTCGPTVDVVEAVRKRFASSSVRFIHIEIYEDNLPGNGVNRWVKEWKLPTEPWVLVVDRGGIVRDRFEGAVSVPELERSVRTNLIR